MRVEVINTGTEILLGNVTNTHLGYFGRELFPLGLRITWQTCVPDGPAIREALTEAFARAEIVLVTGGLGPTTDDLTREITAELLSRPLELNPEAEAALNAYFARLGRPVNERSRRQAFAPAGATVLLNARGTAPGLYLPAGPGTPHLFLMPGPPRELRPMFSGQVMDIIRAILPADFPRPGCRIYRTVGMGESAIEELVGPQLLAIPGLELGYCARVGEVDVRVIGDEPALAAAEAIILPALGAQIFSLETEELEQVVVAELTARRQTLAVAESCTGGLLSNRITDVPGASAVFTAGFTTYAPAAKIAVLGVVADLIEQHSVYSPEVAAAMAEGARRVGQADYALSTTGIAGPDGGTEDKPAGTVFIGLATPERTEVERHFFPGDRELFKRRTTQAGLDFLRRALH